MTFRARTGEGAQAIHLNRFAKREEGWAVYEPQTGSCEVTINTGDLGDGNVALSVQSGVALLNGTRLEIEPQTIDVPQALTEPRKDVIALTENGALFRAGGDQAVKQPSDRALIYSERPAPPDLWEDPVVPLAVISVPADAESITTTEIRDIRPAADYKVGTINGTNPADWVTDDELANYDGGSGGSGSYLPLSGGTLSGDLTIDSGTASNLFLANNGNNSLRVQSRESGEISWDVYDSTGTQIATPFGVTSNGVFDVNNGMGVTGDATFGGSVTVNQLLTADSAELTSVGQAGYAMGSGVHYSRDSNGRAVIYSVSSDGGNGWEFHDPDGAGDAVTIESNGDVDVTGVLDANELLQNGTPVLDSIEVLKSGTGAGTATSLNFNSNLSVSVSNDGVATIDASTSDSGGLSSVSIADSGTDVGDATKIDFGDNLDASVTDGVASVIGSGGSGTGYGDEGYAYGTYGSGSSGSAVSAVDYGADASGSTSSTAALQQAIDNAEEGDMVVWGAKGTYYLDGEIVIDKRIELNLGEGVIESDYHDEASYTQQNHYMPLFRVQGTLGGDSQLQSPTNRGEDEIHVSDPENFSVGEGVILRNSTNSLGTPVPGTDYMPTQTKIREIQNGIIYLEDNALRNYTTADYLTHAEYVTRPIIRNLTIKNRRDLAFDSTAGKVLGGFRHAIATEVCDNPLIENCTVEGYDSHLWTSRDDIAPEIRDCGARRPMNLSGSCGEPVHIQGSRDVSVVRPTIKEARRGIDVRSGCSRVTVEEPDITGISLYGISWHSTATVESDIVVNGGRVECKPDDPTMDNKDGSLDRRQELQQGAPFTTAVNATLISNDVTYVGRINATINGAADIHGGEIYKYRNAGTVLTLDGEDISIHGTEIGSYGPVSRLVAAEANTNASNVTMEDIRFDCSGGPTQVAEILGGEDIRIAGHATAGAGRIGEIEAGSNITFDINCVANGSYVYAIYGGRHVTINGTATGSVDNSQIHIADGTDITIDADLRASSVAGAQGVRIFGGTDIDITGVYQGPAAGVMFSGDASHVSIHDMRIEVTDTGANYAIGTDTSPTALTGVKCLDNDLRGSVDNIDMNVDVTGLWAVNNTASDVSYTSTTTVGQVAGNLNI